MPLENTFFASGRDCELACDEAVLGKISEEEGSAYGACLLKSVEQKLHINHRMVMTTNMSTDKKFMKERIVNIMNRKKKSRITMVLAVAIMMVVTGCAYEKQNVDTSKQESLTSEIEETTEGNEPELSEETEGKSESQEESAEPETKNDSQVVKETTEDTSFVEPFGEEMSVDAATEKKMNIFLSNFSEAGLYTYDKEDPDINNICWWVHIWMKINKSENIEYESRSDQTYEKISLEQLNQVTEKYLGITIEDEEAALVKSEWFFFENGNFYSPAADGESYTGLSIVSKVEKLSDGRLKLYYNNYYQDIDAYLEGKDKNFSMTEEEASKNPDYEKSNSGYAIVRTEGSSYILEYLEVKEQVNLNINELSESSSEDEISGNLSYLKGKEKDDSEPCPTVLDINRECPFSLAFSGFAVYGKDFLSFGCRFKPSQNGGNVNGHGKNGKLLSRASKGTQSYTS